MAIKTMRIGIEQHNYGYVEYEIDTDKLEQPWEEMTEGEQIAAVIENGELIDEFINKSDTYYPGFID